MRDGLVRLCSEAGLSPVLEARFLLADGRKPGDLYLNNFGPNLESVCLDVTVASVIRTGMLEDLLMILLCRSEETESSR